MKNRFLFSLVCFLLCNLIVCQVQTDYSRHIKEANDAYQSQDYERSADLFNAAIETYSEESNSFDIYNAACSNALAGNTRLAFGHLFFIAKNQTILYNDIDHVTSDPDLKSLHKKKKWQKLLRLVSENKKEYQRDFDMDLVHKLDSIYQSDQLPRTQISNLRKKFGNDSNEMKEHWKLIHRTDSANLLSIKNILDSKGWLGPKYIGKKGNNTLFLVIQHSDLETQLHYLPMLREAVTLGNARPEDLALLEDRVALRQGDKQIYGSQVLRNRVTGDRYVAPIRDPENVDTRRSEVGLGKLADYLSLWDMEWDVEEHKVMVEKLEVEKEKAKQ